MNSITLFKTVSDDSFFPLIVGMGDGTTIANLLHSPKRITVTLMEDLNTELKWNMVKAFKAYTTDAHKSDLDVRHKDIAEGIVEHAMHVGRKYDFIWLEQNTVADPYWLATIESAYKMLISGGVLCIHGCAESPESATKWNVECTTYAHAFAHTLGWRDNVSWWPLIGSDGVMKITRTL